MYNTSNKGLYALIGVIVVLIIVMVILIVVKENFVSIVGFGNEVTINALDNAVEVSRSSLGSY